jgi:hypothetical protein
MPTTIPASSRARRHPVRSRGRSSNMLACAAFAAVGLLLAVLALNFEISLGANSGANSVAAATENVPAIP